MDAGRALRSKLGWRCSGLALLSTAMAYVLFFRILATAGATNLMLVTFLIPVSAILLGAAVLGEQLQSKHLIGMAMIAVGLAAIDGRLFSMAESGPLLIQIPAFPRFVKKEIKFLLRIRES